MKMESAVIDACVLHGRLKRNILLCLAFDNWFMPFWSRRILDETEKSLWNKLGKEKSAEVIERVSVEFPDSLVENYEEHIKEIEFPDENDKHVVAVAKQISTNIIITEDRHFFGNFLDDHDLIAITPDDFIESILKNNIINAISSIKTAKKFNSTC